MREPELQPVVPPELPPFQFSLRTLLLLFVVLGSSLAVFGAWGIVVLALTVGLGEIPFSFIRVCSVFHPWLTWIIHAATTIAKLFPAHVDYRLDHRVTIAGDEFKRGRDLVEGEPMGQHRRRVDPPLGKQSDHRHDTVVLPAHGPKT